MLSVWVVPSVLFQSVSALGRVSEAHLSLVLARMFGGSRQVLQLAASYLVFLLPWYLNETTSVMPCSS